MLLLTRIRYFCFVILFITSGESKFIDNVLYGQLSLRIDGLLTTIAELVGRLKTVEGRLSEKGLDKCADKCVSCEKVNADVSSSNNVTDDEINKELVSLKKAFGAEKENLRYFVELMEQKIDTKMKDVGIETLIELKQQVNLLENEKAEKTWTEQMQDRVSTIKNSLQDVQTSTDELRKRTTIVDAKMTDMQDSTFDIRDRLNEVEINVSSIMASRKRKVSFTAQLRPPEGNVAVLLLENRIVHFNHVFHNDGDGFNTTSGVFTVPVSGVYLFIFFIEGWKVEEDDDCQAAIATLYVDGSRVPIPVFAESMHVRHNVQAGNAYINYFTKGQHVVVGTTETCKNIAFFGYRTTFSGILLY